MILVFGGTTEGKMVADTLNALGLAFLYATKTTVPGVVPHEGGCLSGVLDQEKMQALYTQKGIDLIIDAAHPFAENLHKNVASSVQDSGIPVIRLERERELLPSHPLIQVVKDYPAAIQQLRQLGNPALLALSGVQSIPKLRPYWEESMTYFRILDRPESKAIAQQQQFPKEQLILSFPSASLKEEVALYQQLNIGAVLTKESGGSGHQSLKIQAALIAELPIVILQRPLLPSFDHQVHTIAALHRLLTETLTA